MPIEIGWIEAIFRYPVKSMRGERLDSATLGWHGLEGDRRVALRRLDDRGGFPWLSASKLPELVLFTPRWREGPTPSHVVTPEGQEIVLFGDALAADVGRRHGAPVEPMWLDRGVFDEASISVITSATIGEVCSLAGRASDVRRFRPNVLVRSARETPFEEDEWVGGDLSFGEGSNAPRVSVTLRDVRCAIVNVDPDDGSIDPEMLKTAVRANQNHAGVYATVTHLGGLEVGQRVFFSRRDEVERG
jgi:MOSC domain-containing protein